MSKEPEDRRVLERAHELTPEELAVGSDDPTRQAAVILADSDARTAAAQEASQEAAQEASPEAAQEASQERAQIGVTGLAVMGRNLARNLASRGFG